MGRPPADGEDRREFLKRAGAVVGATVWAVPTMQVVHMASASAQTTGSVVTTTATPSTTTTPNTISFPLYATGDIGCQGAEDKEDQAGTATIWPVQEGIAFQVFLTAAASNWNYYVEGQLELDGCTHGIQVVGRLTTDVNGHGFLSAVYPAAPGPYRFNIDVVSEDGVPPNPRHREIGGFGYVQITVP